MTRRVAEGGCRCGAIRLRAHGRPRPALSNATAATAATRAVHPSRSWPGTCRSRWRLSKERRRSTSRPPASADPSAAIAGGRSRIEDERLAGEVYVMVGAFVHLEPFRAGRARSDLPEAEAGPFCGQDAAVPEEQQTPVTSPVRGIEVLVRGPLGPGGFVR